MIAVNTTYNNLIAAGAQYEWRIINGASTFTKDNLISGKITRTTYEQLSVGNVIAAQLELELRDVTVDTDSILQVQFRATDGSSNSSWYTKGYFFIDTVESSPYSDITKITAYDAMMKAQVVYMKSGTWVGTTTDADIITAILSDISVSASSALTSALATPIAFTNAPDIGDNGTTEMEMLSIIGVMRGWNFFINYNGELDYECPFTARANTAAVGDAVVEFDASPSETVSKVKVWLNSTTYFRKPDLNNDGVTDEDFEDLAGLCLEVDCKFMGSQDVADALYALANGYINYPYKAQSAYIDPKYEVGDGVTIKNVTSEIANYIWTLDPLAPADLEFRGQEIINSYYPYIDPIQREINRQDEFTRASITVLEDSIQSEVSARVLQGESLSQDISDNADRLQEAINNTNTVVTDLSSSLTQTASEINATITQTITDLQSYADSAADTAADDLAATLSTYIRYYQSGGTGVLELGDNASGYTAKLNNQKLSFYDGDTEVAYIANNKLYISNAEITNNLQIGHYQWITDSSGRMSLKWVN